MEPLSYRFDNPLSGDYDRPGSAFSVHAFRLIFISSLAVGYPFIDNAFHLFLNSRESQKDDTP